MDVHRASFEYDWRTRFGLSLDVAGRSMSWGEAIRHTETLSRDPSSHICAALNDWEFPLDRASLALMNHFDLTHNIAWSQGGGKGSRPKPYPRPWKDRTRKVVKPTISQDQVLAALAYAGHTTPPPFVSG